MPADEKSGRWTPPDQKIFPDPDEPEREPITPREPGSLYSVDLKTGRKVYDHIDWKETEPTNRRAAKRVFFKFCFRRSDTLLERFPAETTPKQWKIMAIEEVAGKWGARLTPVEPSEKTREETRFVALKALASGYQPIPKEKK